MGSACTGRAQDRAIAEKGQRGCIRWLKQQKGSLHCRPLSTAKVAGGAHAGAPLPIRRICFPRAGRGRPMDLYRFAEKSAPVAKRSTTAYITKNYDVYYTLIFFQPHAVVLNAARRVFE